MKTRSVTLCPECTACPEVTMHENGTVTIGEDENLVKLDAKEWNVLVDLIRSGVLAEVG